MTVMTVRLDSGGRTQRRPAARTPQGMTRRWVLTGLGGAAVMAACGPLGGSPAGEIRPSAQSGELTWIVADAHTQQIKDWFEQTLIPGFRRERPNAQTTMLFASWGNDFDTKRDTLYAAGNGPDIVQSGAVMVVMYALRKMAVPLDDRLRRWKDWADYYPVTQATMRFRDKQYGIPARVDARAMLYRRDLFQRQGLRLPETWDEMRTAALSLTRRQGDQLEQVGYSPTPFGNQQLFPIVWQNGGEALTPDGRRPAFHSPEGVEALRYWADLLNAIAPPTAKLPPVPPGASGLAAGNVAAQLTGGGVITGAIGGAPEALPHLVVRPPLRQRRQVVNVFNNWYGLGAQSRHLDLAWELLTYFNRPEHLLAFTGMHATPAPRKSLRESGHMTDPRYQMKVWLEVMEKHARPQPLVPNYIDCWRAIDTAMADVRAGKQSPKQALDDAARQWQFILDEAYRAA